MLDYIEKKDNCTKYRNCHSLAIIDKQAMKIVRKSLSQLLDILAENIKNGKWNDTDILYIVPTGKEFHTIPTNRIKNDKFIACISDGNTITKKKGSIIPLMNWVKENMDLNHNNLYISRGCTFGE